MSESSEKDIFIPTFPAKERTCLLKRKEQLLELNPDDTDVFEKNIIEKYSCRDTGKWGNTSLIEYAAYKTEGKNNKRSKPRIIRFVNYKLKIDPVNFYREQVLLYLP